MTRDELELLTADEEQRRALPVMGSLADQSISPHEIAAARVAQAARPAAGRTEGAATELPWRVLTQPVRVARGLMESNIQSAGEQFPLQTMAPGSILNVSTDVDPRRRAADLGAETALNVTGLPALGARVPAGSTSMGAAARDPNLWHDLSRVKLARPVSEMQANHVPTQAVAEKVITPADLQGGVLLPAIGNRSATGSRLTGFNGYPFDRPVEMQGGHGFMPAQAEKGVAWASNPGVVTRLANKTRALSETGKDVYFPYTAMHHEGADFSHHVSDTLSEAVKQARVSNAAKSEFNAAMKADHIDFGKVPDWPGVGSAKLREYLLASPGDVRNKFAKVMDTAKFQELGFPSVAEARHAITDPRLLEAPRGSAGLSISKLDPAGTAIKDPTLHRTYPVGLAGEYVGGFGRQIPRDVMYPEIVKGYEKLGSDPNLFMALGRTGAPIAQRANQKWVDTVSKWMEKNPREAMKYALPPAALGGLAAQDQYQRQGGM